MTWFTVAQLLLAAGVVALVAERVRTLLYRAPLDTKPWLAALRAAVADGDDAAARALIEAARPAWAAEVARATLGDGAEGGDSAEELLADYRYEAFRRLRALRILASAGTASGFLGAILELIWLWSGEHGLAGLAAGRVEAVAMHRALVAVALGLAISFFAWAALGVLKRAALLLLADLRRTVIDLDPGEGR